MKAIKLLGAFTVLASLAPAVAAPPSASDVMAWTVFAQMTAPAGAKQVIFETWASDDDIYSGAKPVWPQRSAKLLRPSLAAHAEAVAVTGHITPAENDCRPKDGAAGNFPPGACIGEQVQHNLPVFRTIADNGLFTTAGLVKAYGSTKPIEFPRDSIVVKADWVLVSDILRWLPQYKNADAVRNAYYTNTATMNGRQGEYALVGMSVQSRQLPQWLWMTFEHRSNPGRCDVIGCHDSFGAVAASVAPAAAPNTDYGPCTKTVAVKALLGAHHIDPIWDNYCLKGTQTVFTAQGSPTILANSVIERMNKGVPVQQTSCITCHAYAAFDVKGAPNYAILPTHPRGAVQPLLLKGYKLHDYVWGLLAIKH